MKAKIPELAKIEKNEDGQVEIACSDEEPCGDVLKCCNKKCVLSYADDKCENENRLEGDACDLSTPNIYWN